MNENASLPILRGLLPAPATALHDATYLALALPIGVVSFSFVITGLSLAAGLAITLLGIPVLLGTLLGARLLAQLERLRATPVLGERLSGPERMLYGSWWERTKTLVTDPASWRDLVWAFMLGPIGVAGFTVAVTAWSTVLGLITSPLWYWALPEEHDETLALLEDPSAEWALARVAVGVALIPVAAWVCRGLAWGTARTAKALLSRA
jgi:hypothetical protein